MWMQRGLWPAKWISHLEARETPFVAAYRLPFNLETARHVRLHLTADERYELFLDGTFIGRGPERGDPENWFFETYEGEIPAGEHVLVAKVWSLGDKAPFAQLSLRHGFLLSPEAEDLVPLLATGEASWTAKLLGGFGWQSPQSAWGTGWNQVINGAEYDWGHETGDGEGWTEVNAGVKGARAGSQQEVIAHHRLRPAMLPPMLNEPRQGGTVRFVSGFESRPVSRVPVQAAANLEAEIAGWQSMVSGNSPITIPPHTRRRVIIDLEEYYCARPELTISGGRESRVEIDWAEALYVNTERWPKGNRDEIEGKYFAPVRREEDGPGDVFLPEGGHNREYRTLWWQAGRYVQMLVETGDEPLTIERFRYLETRYPLENEGQFKGAPELEEPIPIMVRGMQMCAHETYMDCPFYEQLMYVGDTRLEVLTTYVMTSDERLPRKALKIFDWSRLLSGLTQSRYPSWARQIIPPFSMWWVAMVHDYALWRGDPEFTRSLLPGMRAVCDHFAALINEDDLMTAPDGWNFTDWVSTSAESQKYYGGDPKWRGGIPPAANFGISGILNWQAALTFRLASNIENWFGEPELELLQLRRAQRIATAADKHFWNADRGLYADDLAHENWSEHAQCLALISGLMPRKKISLVEKGLLEDADLARTTIYFTHYLFEAYRVLGRMDAFFERLKLWDDLVHQGLKTTIEMPEPTRSDCHAWGAHPLFHYYATIAGIRPVQPGFSVIDVKPQLMHLERVEGVLPHPRGKIHFHFSVKEDSILLEVPEGIAISRQVNSNGLVMKTYPFLPATNGRKLWTGKLTDHAR